MCIRDRSRVTFNGSTAYVSSQYLTTEKPEDKSKNSALKQLTLLQGTLTPEFSKDITEYTVQVGTDVTELQLDAIPEDEKAKVKAVSYTHLDVYKRQSHRCFLLQIN